MMQNLVYPITLMLMFIWSLGYFIFDIGSIVHILLLMAVIVLLANIINEKKIE